MLGTCGLVKDGGTACDVGGVVVLPNLCRAESPSGAEAA